MCSVVGCGSWRRDARRFRLPEDPESRLEWVQFLFEVNGQRLRESSWTDITICNEHFTEDCFERPTKPGAVRLKPSAVPSVSVQAGRSAGRAATEPEETTEVACQCDEACIDPNSYSKKSKQTLADYVTSGYDCMQRNILNFDLDKETIAIQQEGKLVVNESCLLQLFRRSCPSCGCKLQMEKVTCGVLVVLNQRCLQCEYRNQWKSQVNASVPTAEDQQLMDGAEVTSEAPKEVPADDNRGHKIFSEIVTFSDEECDPSDEGEEGDKCDEGAEGETSSDGEWNPTEDILLAEELRRESEEETGDEEEEDLNSPAGLKINELCTECGSFFNVQKPHTCEHKIKPYSCNICGKRCVTELSLKNHSIIHDETYEHPCKYCHVTFKTRLDKLKHEQIHLDRKDPYKCPDCPQTFATNKARRVHLANHRTEKEFKCGVCGIVFNDVHHLRRHSVVHTGLKPYKCSVCQRGFNQGSHLKSHMRLHTGERPYKCQRCDKRFNHNVSLKSHVQRYHSRRKWEIDGKAGDSGDAADSGDKRGTDSESDSVEEEEEEVQKEVADVPKRGRRCTGRPKGRPKRNAPGNLILAGQKDRRSNTKTKSRKLKKMVSMDEESENEQSVSNSSEEDEQAEETMKKSTGRSRRRPKNGSDSDFDPELETKRKRYSSHSSGKSKGRPKKNVVV